MPHKGMQHTVHFVSAIMSLLCIVSETATSLSVTRRLDNTNLSGSQSYWKGLIVNKIFRESAAVILFSSFSDQAYATPFEHCYTENTIRYAQIAVFWNHALCK